MGKHIRRARAVECGRSMPPLRHTPMGQPFDITGSDAARWLCAQPSVMQYVFDAAKECGAIVYDPESRTWRGVDR